MKGNILIIGSGISGSTAARMIIRFTVEDYFPFTKDSSLLQTFLGLSA